MKQLSILIKPASAACNLRCKYCFYADISRIRSTASYGIMKISLLDTMLERIRSELSPTDRITFAFQGGEPTLAGLAFFQHFTEVVSQWDPGIHAEYSLQTNGILLDDDWCTFLKAHNFLTGLSLDLLPREHSDARIFPSGEGSWKQACAALALLKKHRVEHNVLCTLTNRIARHPREVWKQICKLDIQYVQFTPCLNDMEATEQGAFALEPKHFASFYKELFPLWLQDFRAGKYRSVKFFDDLVNLLAFGRVTACGMTGRCQHQTIVESDGSVYPCDFYCLDQYCLGNIAKDTLSVLLSSPKAGSFVGRPHTIPTLCSSCQFAKICGGNCKRMQSSMCCTGDESYCGYRDFLTGCYRDLAVIALQQRNFRLQGRF